MTRQRMPERTAGHLTRRDFVRLLGAGVAMSTWSAGQTHAAEENPPKRPNLLFILTDDQGWADLSAPLDPGTPEARCASFVTPNMDRLAREGMRFTNGYSPAPICTPTRRSVQFGMTPARQRGTEFIGDFTPEGHPAIPHILKQADPTYRCAHFGKWGEVMSGKTYGDKNMAANPVALGYDESDGLTGNITGTFHHNRLDANNAHRNWICEADHDPKRTLSVTDRAIAFLERQAQDGRPFYLQVSYYAIHTAYQALPSTLERYAGKEPPDRQVMAGIAPMLEDLDAGVGRLLAALERLGIADTTYVVLSADNGGEPGPQFRKGTSPLPPRNHPLRMHKQTLYEGGIRVPFVVRGPGVRPGSVCAVPVTQCDLLPTFHDLAGGKASLPADTDGGSLRPLLENGGIGEVSRPFPALVFHRPMLRNMPHSAIRQGDWKLVVHWTAPWEPSRRELYDLGRDIGEANDLAKDMPEKADELYALLVSYLKSVNAELPPRPRPPAPKTLPELPVPRLAKAPLIDGRLDEWPGPGGVGALALTGKPGDPPSEAWVGCDDEALYVAVRNAVGNTAVLTADREPPWGQDRVVLAIQKAAERPGPVLTLLGLPKGRMLNHNYTKAPADRYQRLYEGADYAAAIAEESWSCEWRIPFAAMGFGPGVPPRIRFNLIVKKTEPTASCVWRSTGGYMWELDRAGILVLDQENRREE